MKTTLFAVVPGESPDEAADNSHMAFMPLCDTADDECGGMNPIFDRYRLYTDHSQVDHDGIYSLSESETQEMMEDIWKGMVEDLRAIDNDEDECEVLMPGTAARTRKFRIYDEQGRPVLSPTHYSSLTDRDDYWVVAALFSW